MKNMFGYIFGLIFAIAIVILIFMVFGLGSMTKEVLTTDFDCVNQIADDYCLKNNCVVVKKGTAWNTMKPQIMDYDEREKRYFELTPEEKEFCKK